MELTLSRRVAIITGPAKGMGAAISLGFAREGAVLALVGRDTAAIGPVLEQARAFGVDAMTLACDVTDTAAVEAMVAAVEQRCGRVDILVNVAGGSGPVGGMGWETTREQFDEIVTLNMAGCFNTMRAVLPGMTARRYGKIVNVGGTSACAGGRGGWRIRPRNGVCEGSPSRWRSRPGRSTSTSIA